MNKQTGLNVPINVHLPVFLMGHLIKKLLVAAGLLSHTITIPPCQNLCHWLSRPTPYTKHIPCVSYDICVSGSCEGMPLACYSSAGAPCWPPSILRCWCCGWVTRHKLTSRGSSGVKVQGTMVRELMQLLPITARCVQFKLDENTHLKEFTALLCLSSSPSSSSYLSNREECLYLNTTL